MDSDMRFVDCIGPVNATSVALMTEKARTYGDSWKRRGGRGAWYTLVRPMDRLVNRLEDEFGGDIFAAVAAQPEGGDGTVLDAIRDLRNYLTLVEAEMVAQGVVTLPTAPAPTWEDRPTLAAEEHPEGWIILRDGVRATAGYATEDLAWASVGVSLSRPGTPEDGGHHAGQSLEDAGGVSSGPAATTLPGGAPHGPLELALRSLDSDIRSRVRSYGFTVNEKETRMVRDLDHHSGHLRFGMEVHFSADPRTIAR